MQKIVCLSLVVMNVFLLVPAAGQESAAVPISADAINGANLATSFVVDDRPYIFAPGQAIGGSELEPAAPVAPNPAIVRAQVLLDQQGASPGVIDGYDGENVRKAVMAFQAMSGMPVTGNLDAQVVARLETGQPVIGSYVISAEDAADITGPIPADYAEKAELAFLGYASVAEKLAERFHMDIDLLTALNPGSSFAEGDTVQAAVAGAARTGVVTRIEADKTLRQVRAYDAQGALVAAYPATIGSEDNPSPSGSYLVEVVAPMPTYTYNPAINFQQGDNTEVLTIPPGPNGPVGTIWIALSKPTYGIHGTPEPSQIDKTGSHGCVRLTNWDAEELAGMVASGVSVDFL
jgi:lipoprotein-anchoring transpeptidase ErfK/SrfK